MNVKLRRRKLLGALGGAGLLLPLLERGRARAAEGAYPKRLIIVQTTNGTVANEFWPKQTGERDFELDSTILQPLAPFKQKLILIGGLEMTAALDETIATAGGLGHHNLPHLLTGTQGASGRIPDGRTDPVGNAISVDQFVARALESQAMTAFRSLELGVLTNGLTGGRGDNDGLISFNGPAIGSDPARPDGNLPEEDPARFLERLLGAGAGAGETSALDETARARRLLEDRSVLDLVRTDLERLKQNLGQDERAKLDAHLEGLRRVEQELTHSMPLSCDFPNAALPAGTPIDKAESMPMIVTAQMDLLTLALSCDLTRVVTLMMTNGANEDLAMPWLGEGFSGPPAEVGNYKVRDHHNLTHAGNFRPQKIRAEQWFMEQFAYLLERLDAVPEGDGTLLDHSVVFWANNMSDGHEHACQGMPWLLAGSCGGYFETGRYLRYGDWAQGAFDSGSNLLPHNGVLVALANAMDAPTEFFNNRDYGGELPGLSA
jgi:hypothetical protein